MINSYPYSHSFHIKALAPYIYSNQLNFKNKPFEVWKEHGLPWVNGWYPRILHKLMFCLDMPTLWHGEARLVFVQPVTLYFDTFFVAPFHEMIPMVWDCWEEYDDKMVRWLKRHKVRKAIFTSEISAERIKARVPELDILVITEGIDCENYPKGKELKDRTLDMFNYGRMPSWAACSPRCTDKEFANNLQNAKVTVCVPRSDVNPKCHETLTQRYWECMLSRMVMVGRAPRELIDLIGYDPVIHVDTNNVEAQMHDILAHISDYQALVDRNRETALKMGDWKLRMLKVYEWWELEKPKQ